MRSSIRRFRQLTRSRSQVVEAENSVTAEAIDKAGAILAGANDAY